MSRPHKWEKGHPNATHIGIGGSLGSNTGGPKPGKKITEDSPYWNAQTMGNRRAGKPTLGGSAGAKTRRRK